MAEFFATVSDPDVRAAGTTPRTGPVDESLAQTIKAVGTLATAARAGALEAEAEGAIEAERKAFISNVKMGQEAQFQEAVLGTQLEENQLTDEERALTQDAYDRSRRLRLAAEQGAITNTEFKIRMENTLRSFISRAPGLASNFRDIARATLGFDPTGSALQAAMQVQADEEARRSQTDGATYAQKLSFAEDMFKFSPGSWSKPPSQMSEAELDAAVLNAYPSYQQRLAGQVALQQQEQFLSNQQSVGKAMLDTTISNNLPQIKQRVESGLAQMMQGVFGKPVHEIRSSDIAKLSADELEQLVFAVEQDRNNALIAANMAGRDGRPAYSQAEFNQRYGDTLTQTHTQLLDILGGEKAAERAESLIALQGLDWMNRNLNETYLGALRVAKFLPNQPYMLEGELRNLLNLSLAGNSGIRTNDPAGTVFSNPAQVRNWSPEAQTSAANFREQYGEVITQGLESVGWDNYSSADQNALLTSMQDESQAFASGAQNVPKELLDKTLTQFSNPVYAEIFNDPRAAQIRENYQAGVLYAIETLDNEMREDVIGNNMGDMVIPAGSYAVEVLNGEYQIRVSDNIDEVVKTYFGVDTLNDFHKEYQKRLVGRIFEVQDRYLDPINDYTRSLAHIQGSTDYARAQQFLAGSLAVSVPNELLRGERKQ